MFSQTARRSSQLSPRNCRASSSRLLSWTRLNWMSCDRDELLSPEVGEMSDQNNGPAAVDLARGQARILQQLGEEHQKLIEAVQQLTAERDRLRRELTRAVAEGEQYRKSLGYYLAKEFTLTEEQLLQ